MRRRYFIKAGVGETMGLASNVFANPLPAPASSRTFSLWGGPPATPLPAEPEGEERMTEEYVELCARHGVTRIFPSGGSSILTKVAGKRGIEVHPYASFNYHGGRPIYYTWSLNFLVPPVESDEGERLLAHHHPIWGAPVSNVAIPEFAKQHPELWSKARDHHNDFEPGERLSFSLAIPEARRYVVNRYIEMYETKGGKGILLEFVLKNMDRNGIETSGYEESMVAAFQEKHGRSPMDLPNDDPAWMQCRADYNTQTVKELRTQLRDNHPEAGMRATVIARPKDDYLKVLQDWPAWVAQALVDEFIIWFRTTTNLEEVESYTRHAAQVINGRCPLTVEFSCYHPGSFQDPKLMLEAARRAKGNGATSLGVYRSDSVDQLNLWPVVEQIAKL